MVHTVPIGLGLGLARVLVLTPASDPVLARDQAHATCAPVPTATPDQSAFVLVLGPDRVQVTTVAISLSLVPGRALDLRHIGMDIDILIRIAVLEVDHRAPPGDRVLDLPVHLIHQLVVNIREIVRNA